MSLRRHVLRVVALATAVAMVFAAFAGSASAKKMSPKQKAHVRAELRKQIKKNPRALYRKSFLRKARSVDFVLPATIRVGRVTGAGATGYQWSGQGGTASLDLGPSLGTRTIGLAGSLPAEIEFSDSFDGGALGNVKLRLLSGGNADMGLKSTSLPLLSNSNTTAASFGGGTPNNSLNPQQGCNGWTADPWGNPPLADDPASLGFSTDPGYNNLGHGPYSPDNAVADTGMGDVVLRTAPLNLTIAAPNAAGVTLPGGNTSVTIGPSGGVANLFGQIPGKTSSSAGNNQIDVTANLQTKINSILRETDPGPAVSNYPANPAVNKATLFACRQAITGSTNNYLLGVRLGGNLRINPAITADGKLRIATANLVNQGSTRISVGACLVPLTGYANNVAPTTALGATDIITSFLTSTALPATTNEIAAGHKNVYTDTPFGGGSLINNTACNATPDPIVAGLGVSALPLSPGAGYSTTDNGSQVNVSAEITSLALKAEVLVGGNQTAPVPLG